MQCALIMAGGSGQRFWPLSTSERPKQLLSLFSDRTMIRETVDRISDLIPYEQIFIGTNVVQAVGIKAELPMLPDENIIIEPAFKDTAAAVGYGATFINKRYPNAELVVLASDHLIKDVAGFHHILELGIKEAREHGTIVTLGIKPSHPETGYGYIESQGKSQLNHLCNVERFCEKPDLETATNYVEAGNYLWNSGMFIFSIETILSEMSKYMPNHFSVIKSMKTYVDQGLVGESLAEATKSLFDLFERISIDYGIMEQSKLIKVIPCEIGWNDIGSYTALEDVFEKNTNGSIIRKAEAKEIDSKNNIVYLEGDEIALIGVENLVVVKSEGKLLICHRDHLQDLKKIF
jgi:mannose-1-phosphate guanylyltransferase